MPPTDSPQATSASSPDAEPASGADVRQSQRKGLVLFAGVVGLWWFLRVAGLFGMRAFRELELRPLHLVQALGTETLWLLALAFVGHLTLRPRAEQTAPAATRRHALIRALVGRLTLSFVPFVLLCTAVMVLRVADTLSCYFALAHMTVSVWSHISWGSFGYIWDPRAMALLIVVLGAGASLAWALAFAGDGLAQLPIAQQPRRRGLAMVVGVLIAWGTPALQHHDPHHWALIPEVNAVWTFGASLHTSERTDPAKVVVTPIPDASAARLRAAGVLPPGVDAKARFPLLRGDYGKKDVLQPAKSVPKGLVDVATFHRATLADPTRKGGKATRPPNVLLVLVESLSAGFTGLHPKSRNKDLMPNLSQIAGRMTQVHGFHNIASPTANGLIASLCATLPAAAVQDVEVGGSVDGQAAYRCLSDVLRDHGYTTRFVRGASKVYMACEATLRGHGFDAVAGREDLHKRYAHRPTNTWGYDDATLVDELTRQMKELRGKGKPWMLATLTVGTHLPGFPDEGCPIPKKIAGETVLAGYYCADRQLGRLFKVLTELDMWKDTVVVLTGDHAQLPTNEVKRLIGEPALFGTFAPMPLLIHDPLHALPADASVLSGQLDLAPTILHLLGVPAVEHSFLGYSIFGERRNHPFLFGRVGSRSAYVQSPSERHELTLAALARACELERPLLKDGSAPISACDLSHFFNWLDSLWRGHRLFPKERYTGGAGADAELLRLKWLRYDAKEARQRGGAGH
ncbi:MAG: LTA synthase family protein [Myxococcales bacterium]|nr:LTA synthase family protein [Myxococcales bacterium]